MVADTGGGGAVAGAWTVGAKARREGMADQPNEAAVSSASPPDTLVVDGVPAGKGTTHKRC